MKFRNRELNIFSMSALDLFASALGAFILISIVLMPYFLRTDPKEVERLRANLEQAQAAAAESQRRQAQAQAAAARARASLQQCQQREAACRRELESQRQRGAALQRCQADLRACKIKLSKTFLAFVIQWPTNRHDVDLHVTDAAGREFYYRRKRIAGRPGELSADTTRGPGVEIWEVAVAPVGRYQVRYNLYARKGNPAPAVVKGGVYHRDGHHRFRQRRLTAVGRRRALLVATVTVRSGGNVQITEH